MTEKVVGRCNVTALRKATRHVSQFYDATLAATGLRATQVSILSYVARGGSPTMNELAAALVLDRTGLTHNLKPLQRDGLLEVAIDRDDRRIRRIRLTKRGETRLAEATAVWQRAQDGFEAAFGAKQAVALRKVLAVVAALDFPG